MTAIELREQEDMSRGRACERTSMESWRTRCMTVLDWGLLETDLEVEVEVLTQEAGSAGGFLCCVHRP
jgi:hypothetical protein